MITVISSNGQIEIDLTGNVLSCQMNEDGEGIDKITRFDLAEYHQTYGPDIPQTIDILDLGYWSGDIYESPAYDWRALDK